MRDKRNEGVVFEMGVREKFDHFIVPVAKWHQIINSSKKNTHIIEIQYGDECIEDDIERIQIK